MSAHVKAKKQTSEGTTRAKDEAIIPSSAYVKFRSSAWKLVAKWRKNIYIIGLHLTDDFLWLDSNRYSCSRCYLQLYAKTYIQEWFN